jgi:hypothetical protein
MSGGISLTVANLPWKADNRLGVRSVGRRGGPGAPFGFARAIRRFRSRMGLSHEAAVLVAALWCSSKNVAQRVFAGGKFAPQYHLTKPRNGLINCANLNGRRLLWGRSPVAVLADDE